MLSETGQLFEFGPFRADALRRLLLRDGEVVPLTSKAFDTLLVLVRNRDRVLEKEELLHSIWPDSFVEEANLAQNVSAVRKALGEIPGEHRYIATVPGRGYRFVGDVRLVAPETEVTLERRTMAEVVVEEEEHDETARAWRLSRRQTMVAAALLAAIVLGIAGWRFWRNATADVTATRSIAVLPFQPLSGQGENPLGLGLADAVITKLTNVHRLIVRPTNSILKYAQTPAAPQAAGRDLDVEAVLEGRVQQAGERIRVTVQLVRVADERPLWAETFDSNFADVFAIEDTISEGVAQALAVRLAQGEKERVDRRYTDNLEAYRNYLDGRFAGFQFTPDGLKRAIAYFDRAVAIDSRYALAYAGLADAYTTAADWVLPPREALAQAEAAARQALVFDEGLAEAHSALGHAEMHAWKLADAGKEFARALALNPNVTSVYFSYGEYLTAIGKEDAAVAEYRKALKIDPQSAEILMMLPFALYMKHDFAAAEAAGSAAIQAHPEFWAPYMGRGYSHLARKQYAEAIADFEKGRTLNPEATINLCGLAAAQAGAGNRKAAEDVLHDMLQMRSQRYVSPFDVAIAYIGLGEREQALDWLEKAYQDESEMLLFVGSYPPAADLRSDPRFQELMRRVGAAGR
ncbi:MAG TPA: winged helix-turn-helix domain-containing protein [Bryobacteraceae bacterium]|nr:winged helix-turn-helix domain-containing protein [Bryobacteraceae bacterium]